jgi:hypothetical protein
VRTLVDARFLEEAAASGLRFCCDDCVHFDTRAFACSLGYPVDAHRPGVLVPGSVVVFCKEFDLGGAA